MLTPGPCYRTSDEALEDAQRVVRGVLEMDTEPGKVDWLVRQRVDPLFFALGRFEVVGPAERATTGVCLLVLRDVKRGWCWRHAVVSVPPDQALGQSAEYLVRFVAGTEAALDFWWAFGRCRSEVAHIRALVGGRQAVEVRPEREWFAVGGPGSGFVEFQVLDPRGDLLEAVRPLGYVGHSAAQNEDEPHEQHEHHDGDVPIVAEIRAELHLEQR